ncbi:hypothetical protein GX48_07246 [Paracoccidioides brasiliensis]|nr:hypothetical protein GX48_07246 [Paracoccidioides brasiliensis]
MAKGNDENQSQFTGGYPPTPQEHQVFSNDAEVIGDSDIFLKKGKVCLTNSLSLRRANRWLDLKLSINRYFNPFLIGGEMYGHYQRTIYPTGADIQHLRVFERGSPSDSHLLARAAHYITESYEYNGDPTAAAVGSQANVKINDSTTELNDRPSQPIEQTSSPITKTLAQWHVDQGHIHVDAIIALAKALDSGVRIKGLNSQNLDIMI